MSLQLLTLLWVMLSGFSLVLSKWKKSLMTIVLLEALAASTLALSLSLSGSGGVMVLLLLPFFVSEALILLTSFYSALRLVGSAHTMCMLL